MQYYNPGPPTCTGRVPRIIRNLFTENPIIGGGLRTQRYYEAVGELDSMRATMQEWEDTYIKFLKDPRRRSEYQNEQINYISEVDQWYYEKLLQSDKRLTPKLRQMWTDGDAVGITVANEVDNLRLEQIQQQWSILKTFNDNFCTTAEDMNLLNPTAIGSENALDGENHHRLSKRNLPGLREIGIAGLGPMGVSNLYGNSR